MTGMRVRFSEADTVDEVKECRKHGYLLTSKKIGTGAFSSVYLGIPTENVIRRNFRLASDLQYKKNKMVAIKIVNISQNPYQQSRRFLSREINALQATYKHTNVIQLYETFRSPSRLFLILELAFKGDLLDYVNKIAISKRDLGLREGEAQCLFRQIVSGVAHCHTKHIIHRDLKCENILLDEQGAIKLTDFGLAERCTKSSLMSTFCGSVPYTAPEILLGKSYKGERADIWSMGVILYAMVTGKLPFSECQPQKMLQLIKRGIKFHQQLSPECQDLISRLLQWCPSTRPELTQILGHPWMLPAISVIFQRVRDFLADSPDRKQHQGKGSKGEKASGKANSKAMEVIAYNPKTNGSMHKLGSMEWTGLDLDSVWCQSPQALERPIKDADREPEDSIKLFNHRPRPPSTSRSPRDLARRNVFSCSPRDSHLPSKHPTIQEWIFPLRKARSSQRINYINLLAGQVGMTERR